MADGSAHRAVTVERIAQGVFTVANARGGQDGDCQRRRGEGIGGPAAPATDPGLRSARRPDGGISLTVVPGQAQAS